MEDKNLPVQVHRSKGGSGTHFEDLIRFYCNLKSYILVTCALGRILISAVLIDS